MDDNSKKDRAIALAATIVVFALMLVWLFFDKLSLAVSAEPKPQEDAQIALGEEFLDADLMDLAPLKRGDAPNEDDAARTDEETRTDDYGAPVIDETPDKQVTIPTPVTQQQPSPVQEKKPTAEELEKQRLEREKKQKEEAERRQIEAEMGVFNNSNNGTQLTQGGSPDGDAAKGKIDGTVGHKGGRGWKWPSYVAPQSNKVGKIELQLTLNDDGTVKDVTLVPSKGDASSDKTLVKACTEEAKRRKFSPDGDSPIKDNTVTLIFNYVDKK